MSQHYGNHRRLPKLHAFCLLTMAAALALGICALAMGGGGMAARLAAWAVVVLSVGGVAVILNSRLYALKLQDRIIRLEMSARLARIMPEVWAEHGGKLSLGHLIALRFAPDEELPGLVDAVVEGRLKQGKDIKQAIQNWRGDYHRV